MITGTLMYVPEQRFTPLGSMLMTFSIYTSKYRRVTCYAWSNIAENILRNIDQYNLGMELNCTGYMKLRKYKNRDGHLSVIYEYNLTEIPELVSKKIE